MNKFHIFSLLLILFFTTYSQGDGTTISDSANGGIISKCDTIVAGTVSDTEKKDTSTYPRLDSLINPDTKDTSSEINTDLSDSSQNVIGCPQIDTSSRQVTADLSDSMSESNKKSKRTIDRLTLYNGMTREQDLLSSQIVRLTYNGDWDDVHHQMQKLERIEKKHNLPPISLLLQVSIRAYRLDNNEYNSKLQHDTLETEFLKYVSIAMKDPVLTSNYHLPIHELIYCGIKGFLASRKIDSNPVEAAIQGFNTMTRLEKLIASDSTMYDAYLGLGLFYCSLAKAPAFVKGTLSLTGRQVTLERGLDYLRIAASRGKYVIEPSLMYLAFFLSPYLGHHEIEKDSIFEMMQQRCPENPRYLFMQLDENICFHPEKINARYSERIRKKINAQRNPSAQYKYYYELTKYQFCRYIDTAKCSFKIDPSINLKEFSYYPQFLDIIRQKEQCRNHGSNHKNSSSADCAHAARLTITIPESVDMEKNRKDFYSWHMRDAFKLR